eukprot:gene4419-7794_t
MFVVEEDRCLTKDEWNIINSRKTNPPEYPEEYENKPKKSEKIDPTSFGIDEKRENVDNAKIVKMEGNNDLNSDYMINLSMNAKIIFKNGAPVAGNAYFTYELNNVNNESFTMHVNLSKDKLSGLKETASQLRSFAEKKGRGYNVATSDEKNLISNLIEQIEKIKF